MTSRFEHELRTAHWPKSAAELAAGGVTRAVLRGPRWRQTGHGFYAPETGSGSASEWNPSGGVGGRPPTGQGSRHTAQRILDAAAHVPASGALAGWAAAYVHGVGALDGRDPFTMGLLPVPISLGRDLGRLDTEAVRYVRDRLSPSDRQLRYGMPVTTPLRTAFDGARWASDIVEAVVVIDMLAHALPLDLLELGALSTKGSKWPGVQQARQAALLADAASASPWESRLRMCYVLRARLPRPLVNRPVFSLEGKLLGIADLLDPKAGLVTEFDGQDHRERRQHRADNLREEGLEAANLTVCRVDSLDLRWPTVLAERLGVRHQQGLRRDRRQDRWSLDPPAWWRGRPTS